MNDFLKTSAIIHKHDKDYFDNNNNNNNKKKNDSNSDSNIVVILINFCLLKTTTKSYSTSKLGGKITKTVLSKTERKNGKKTDAFFIFNSILT